MDTQPKIPTLKDSQKPQVKVRGLEAGVTLFDRLKQFKKKDLAFILAGLGTLFMAPLAEHFMMSPESGDGQLQQGWGGGKNGHPGIFDGSGNGPYEPGTSGLAPGSAIGGGSDIITPLNARDPSALVMGPGATQQPPTQSVMPGTPPPTAVATRSDSDLKDALAASARGVGAAAHAAKALLPIPKIALTGGSLRGLGVVSGGTSAVAGGGGISSNGLAPNRASTGGGLGGVRAPSGYKGVARSGTGGGSGGLDALKAAAGGAADSFNNKGAYQGATDAANAAIPAGGSGLGGGGAGGTSATDKPFGGDQNKDGKTVGDSLAFLKAKAIQDAQIALWTKEQEAGDNKLEGLKIRNSMGEAIGGAIGSGLGAEFASCLPMNGGYKSCFSVMPSAYNCVPVDPTGKPTGNVTTLYSASIALYGLSGCKNQGTTTGGAAGATSYKSYYFDPSPNTKLYSCDGQGPRTPIYDRCTPEGDAAKDDTGKKGNPNNVDGLGAGTVNDNATVPQSDMAKSCADIKKLQGFLTDPKNADSGVTAAANAALLTAAAAKFVPFQTFAAGVVAERDAIGGLNVPQPGLTPDCGAATLNMTGKDTLFNQLGSGDKVGGIVGDLLAKDQILALMDAQATAKDASQLQRVKGPAVEDQNSVVARIKAFVADFAIVNADHAKLDRPYQTETDPLDLAGLQATINKIKATPPPNLLSDAGTAAGKIKTAAATVTNELLRLDTMANGALQPQVKPLQDSFGDNGLPTLIQRNGDLDMAVKRTAPLLTAAAPKSDEKLALGKDMKADLDVAQTKITGTTAPIAAYNSPVAPATQAGNQPAAQKAIDEADVAVRTAQADQKGIDDGIRSAVTNAAKPLEIDGATPAK